MCSKKESSQSGTDALREQIKEVILDECFVDSEGRPYAQIYWDYRDELDDFHVERIMNADDPRQEFAYMLEEWTADDHTEYNTCKSVVASMESRELVKPHELEWDQVQDVFQDMGGYVDYATDHFLRQEVYVNIVVDTGDANYDFSLNTPIRSYWYPDSTTFDEDSSLLWLVRQQGYKKSEIVKALKADDYPEDKFLRSVVEEISNAANCMNELVFLVKMPLGVWFNLQDAIRKEAAGEVPYHPKQSRGRGYIVLDKSTTCGLFNPWLGGGSLLNIKLSHDVKLPLRYIFSAKYDGAQGYSVQSVYGAGGGMWDTVLKEIHPMKKKLEKKES